MWRRTWTSARVSRGVLCSRHARPALDYCRRRPNILGISSPLFVDYVQPLTEYLRQYHNSEGTCHVDDRLRWHLHGWDHCSQHCKYTPPNAGRMAWWPWIDDSDLGTLSELPQSTNPRLQMTTKSRSLPSYVSLRLIEWGTFFHGLHGFRRWSSLSYLLPSRLKVWSLI